MSPNPLSASAPYLIVGLGNPGTRYANTRHNAGFMAVGELARRYSLKFSSKQGNAEVARGVIEGTSVLLAKPQTFMNNSGRSVGALVRFYKIPLDRVLVIYDDIALPLGTIRIREKGTDAGHNGVSSIIHHLGTQRFPRIRIGVDRPPVADYNQIDWVLGHFTKDEQRVMDEVLPRVADAVEAILRIGIERAMNVYNTKDAGGKEAEAAATPASKKKDNTAEPPVAPTAKEDNWAERARRIIEQAGRE